MTTRDWTFLTWREKTWGERCQTAVVFALASVFCLALFAAGIMVLGDALGGIARYKAEHNRCLQQATNGYEIKRCQ